MPATDGVGREVLPEEVTFELTPEGQEGAGHVWNWGREGAFWAEGTAFAKAPKPGRF